MRRLAFIQVFIPLMVMVFPAMAQVSGDNLALYDRVDRMEQDLQTLRAQLASRETQATIVVNSPYSILPPQASDTVDPVPAARTLGGRLSDRVNQSEDLLRQLTGRIEWVNHRIDQSAKQIARMQADVDLRFKEMKALPQAAVGADATLTSAPRANAGGSAITAQFNNEDPKTLYNNAYSLAQLGDYAAAENGFRAFVAKYPENRLAGNAQYWLGDIAYSHKDFKRSAILFGEAYKKYPKDVKAPDMLYKFAASFAQLNMKREACQAYSLLFAQYPTIPDRLRRATAADRQRLVCPG